MKKYRFNKTQQEILEGMRIPFAIYQYVDKHVVTLVLSEGFLRLFGYEDREKAYYEMDNDMYVAAHPDDRARIEEAAVRFATEGGVYEAVYRTLKNGREGSGYIMIHAYGEHVYTNDGTKLAYVWYVGEGDYSEGEQTGVLGIRHAFNNALHEESLIVSSRYDRLTGLPTMTHFFEMSQSRRNTTVAEGKLPAMLYFNLCGLKYYNHKYGFAEGDRLLRDFARLLATTFGNDNCCHIAQDHFAAFAFLDGIENLLHCFFEKARNIRNDMPAIRVGIYHDAQDTPVEASVACDRAKLACDVLRGAAKSVFCYYRCELRDRILKKQYILENFDKALEERWIEAYYQPIVRAVNGRVCDEEALSRWIDPEKGTLSPADFIPVLEEAKLIYRLDLFLLERVLEKMNAQRAHGLTVVPHSINLSRSDFESCDIVEEICKLVDNAGFDRSMISIEITESVIGEDFDFMKGQIDRFRSLGFPVWMDDFGNAYSSLDMLQSVDFDLIKFDMGFMQRLNEGSGRVILTELMKLANSLGLETVCEGVETQEQERFLREIGCAKLQGYYFCKPISFKALLDRYANGEQIGYENPDEDDYYKIVGGLNLYDFSVIAGDDDSLGNTFDTLPMGIIEVKGDKTRFLRSNQSYREFIKRYIGLDLSYEGCTFTKYDATFMVNIVRTCCELGKRSYYDEVMPDGSVVHSFARRVSVNPVDGTTAVAIAVLSITDATEGTTYADIARSLAADYYNIYYIDINTEKFIEYSSTAGGDGIAMERHGENFFEECKLAGYRIYEEDRERFFSAFSKEKVLKEIDDNGVFNIQYRLIDSGSPMYVNMKITRMRGDHLIMGISNIDAQMKQQERTKELEKERDMMARLMAISNDYLSLYVINPDTDDYMIASTTDDYSSLGISEVGHNFFAQAEKEVPLVIYSEDLPLFRSRFSKENILREISDGGVFSINYRLMVHGTPRPVNLRIAMIREDGKDKIVAGVKLRSV